MTVSTTSPRMPLYTGNGVTAVYPYTFRVFAATDIVVKVQSGGVETTKTYLTDYTVSGVGSYSGGNVTFVSVPASGDIIAISRAVPLTQTTDLQNQGPYYAQTIEDMSDRSTMEAQQIQAQLDRSLQIRETDYGIVSTALPVPSASSLLGWNSTATGIANITTLTGISVLGNPIVDAYTAGVNFTAGVTTALTLSQAPGSKNQTVVTFNGLVQHKSSYSTSGVTLTFSSAIPVGVTQVEVAQVTTLAVPLTTVPAGTDVSNLVTKATGTTLGRTLGSRAADQIDVRDFGAIGDGSNDDTAAVQAAINFAGDGRWVYFPQPSVRYKITSTLLLSLTSKLRGDGGLLLTETIGYYGTGPCIKGADGNFNYKGSIEYLCITNYAGASATHGIHIYNAAAMWIHKNVIQGFTNGDGVRIEVSAAFLKGAYFNRLHQNYYYSCKRGIALIGSALSGVNGNQIIGGEIADTSGLMTHGIYIDGTGGCSGCTIEDIDIEPPNSLAGGMVAGIECVGAVALCLFKGVRMELRGAVPHYKFSSASYDNLIIGGSYESNSNVPPHYSDSFGVVISDAGYNNQIIRGLSGLNYMENGGFERFAGSPLLPVGSFIDGSTGVRGVDYDILQETGAGNFQNGTSSLRLRSITATGPLRLYWTANAEVIRRMKGQRVEVSMWIKSTGADPSTFTPFLFDGITSNAARDWPNTGTWGQLKIQCFISASASNFQLLLQQSATGADYSTYIDDVQIRIVNDRFNEPPHDMPATLQRHVGAWHAAAAVAPVGGTWATNDVAWAQNPAAGDNTAWIYLGSAWRRTNFSALESSVAYDPPSLADGAGVTTTMTVSGAALGDYVQISFSLDLQGISVTAYVSAANTVSVRFQNESGGVLDLASGTLRARVTKL